MNRLTKRVNGVLVYVGPLNRYPKNGTTAGEMEGDQIRDIMERLEQYEKSGLTPSEVLDLTGAAKPLTMEELREMAERCEAVYVAHTDGREVFRGRKYCAAVLDIAPVFGSMGTHIQAIYGDKLTMWEDDYGKTWVAYHRPPEE